VVKVSWVQRKRKFEQRNGQERGATAKSAGGSHRAPQRHATAEQHLNALETVDPEPIISIRIRILVSLGASAVLALLILLAIVVLCLGNSRAMVGVAGSRHEVRLDDSTYSLNYRHVEGAIQIDGVRGEGLRPLAHSDGDALQETIPPQLAESALQAMQSGDGERWDRCRISLLGWPVPLVTHQLRFRFTAAAAGTTMASEESAVIPVTLWRRRYDVPITPTSEGIVAALLLTAANGLVTYACLGLVERKFITLRTRRYQRLAAAGLCPKCRYPCPPAAACCPECASTLIASNPE